ncbi:hypothetical protein [Ruegeria meonggei]|uniref:hypothetical protein n=1 Tax=Ruegeria meonggei TaxID=1446476 RepID=UPI003670E3B2
MLGIIGLAVLVGLGAGGMALLSGYSILIALGVYALSGWLIIAAAVLVACTARSMKARAQKQGHAYSG